MSPAQQLGNCACQVWSLWLNVMATHHRVYDYSHLLADCLDTGIIHIFIFIYSVKRTLIKRSEPNTRIEHGTLTFSLQRVARPQAMFEYVQVTDNAPAYCELVLTDRSQQPQTETETSETHDWRSRSRFSH